MATNINPIALNPISYVQMGERIIFENKDWQSLNSFKILFFQNSGPLITRPTDDITSVSVAIERPQLNALNVASEIQNKTVASFCLRSISIPLPRFEYEILNYEKKVKNIAYPETVSFTLLEDEQGTVRSFIEMWIRSIARKMSNGQFVFNDDQRISEKKAYVYVTPGFNTDITGTQNEWLRLFGLKFESCTDITLSHEGRDFMAFDITCAVNNVWFPSVDKFRNPLEIGRARELALIAQLS